MSSFNARTTERTYGLAYLVKKFFVVCMGLLLTLFFIQTAKLATVGRMGAEISSLEQRENEMKLQNEVLRSQISELRSSEKVKEAIENDESLGTVNVNIVPSIEDLRGVDVIANQ